MTQSLTSLETLVLLALRVNDESANPEGLSLVQLNRFLPTDQRMPLSELAEAIGTLRNAGLVKRYRLSRPDGTRATKRFRLTRAGHLLAHERDKEAER